MPRHRDDDEQALLDDATWTRRKDQPRWSICIASIISLIIGFTLGAFSHKLPMHQVSRHISKPYLSSAPFGRDVQVVFEPNTTFEKAPPGRAADALWDSLMPIGRGIILLDGDDGVTQTKSVAAFHQMHCLNHIRKALYTAATSSSDPDYLSRLPEVEPHWRHCLDYLRQSLMCNADVTLEEMEFGEGVPLGSVSGWGTRRLCRNWEGLRGWAEGGESGGVVEGCGDCVVLRVTDKERRMRVFFVSMSYGRINVPLFSGNEVV